MSNIYGIDANLIVGLYALLDTGSVTLAARRLGVSQSAMSHKLRGLRERLGDPVLVRTGQRMAITAKAETLAPVVTRLVHELAGVLACEPLPQRVAAKIEHRAATEAAYQRGQADAVAGIVEWYCRRALAAAKGGERCFSLLLEAEAERIQRREWTDGESAVGD